MKTKYYIGTSEVSKEVYDTVQVYKKDNLLLAYENEKYKKALEIIKTYYDIDIKGQLVHKVAYVWHKDSVGFDYELKEKPQEIEFLKEVLK